MDQRDALMKKAERPMAEAMRLHPLYRGKVQMVPKCPVRGMEDFAVWYSPGVAAPCRAIAADPAAVYQHTNKGNSIAIVSDGSRVLGLGDIGPAAGLPVMEGKALLFKYLGGVDAVPLCIDAHEADEIVRIVRALAPSFGAINLEDIAQPKCFRILDALRTGLGIPVWHDDQQGSATVALAGLKSALSILGKKLDTARIAMVGMGAANVAVYRLLKAAGVDPTAIVACDSKGILHPGREDIARQQAVFPDKWRVCLESNGDRVVGAVAEALRGADACIAFSRSGPGVIEPAWIAGMAREAIVFACANPVPEIWPWDAMAAGARIVATGRSDFPNQVNNSLVFPGMFRGVLDIRARAITDGMALAVADELVRQAVRLGAGETRILPGMEEWEMAAHVAAACGVAAQKEGAAGRVASGSDLYAMAYGAIAEARRTTEVLMREGLIAMPPAQA